MVQQTDYIFQIELFLFKVITWGVLAYVFMGVVIIVMFLTIVWLLQHFKLIKYTINEKILFMKNYFYMFSLQKYHFIKSYLKEITKGANKNRVFLIIIGVMIIVIIFGFIIYSVLKSKS